MLAAAKECLPHGDFGEMVNTRLPFSASTAQRLMAIAADPKISNPAHVQHLPNSWGTLYALTRLDEKEFGAAIEAKLIRPDMDRSDVLQMTGARNTESRRKLAAELSLASSLSSTGRKFPVIYADPAWHRKAGIGDRAYENHYPTEGWDSILDMPVAKRVLPDAWLFLWIPRAHLLALHPTKIDTPLGKTIVKLPLAYAVAQAWGFDAYSTCFVWTKTDEESPNDHGLGLLVWDQDEILCLFKRGRGLPKPDTDKKVGSNHREPSTKHSAKPTYYRDMINAMTGGVPVLELFAREDDKTILPPNFFTWGNQSKNTAETYDCETGEIEHDASEAPSPSPLDVSSEPAPSPSGAGSLVSEDEDVLDIPAFLGGKNSSKTLTDSGDAN